MRDRGPQSLDTRRRLLNYCRVAPGRASAGAPDFRLPIWQYWHSGPDNAPDLVKGCMRSVKRHAGGRKVIVLDQTTLADYVSIPDELLKVQAIGMPQFADIVRLYLLARYGGIWVDATVFLSGPIPEDIGRQGFFAFERDSDPYLLSNWFLAAMPGNALVESMILSLLAYWRENDRLLHYFIFHFMFEGLVSLSEPLRQEWQAGLKLSATPPHRMQKFLPRPYDKAKFQEILTETNIHKLTHKFRDVQPGPGSYCFKIAEL